MVPDSRVCVVPDAVHVKECHLLELKLDVLLQPTKSTSTIHERDEDMMYKIV
ncbi:unnamed protein product [Ectocarpus sp. CCAP 1310/34]|nr:unnamed protein product [Ectocarpus sp. CCAP 1310/34]